MKTPSRPPGSRFYAADLHTHTPASHDYSDKSISAKAWVDAAVAARIDVIAVTDHNSAEWVDKIRDTAKGTGLIVFPGVEVSTPHCHILAIFDRHTPKHVIDDFLTTVGITTVDRGKKEVVAKSLEVVLDEIATFGGLAIAPHANSSNGFMQQGSGQYRMKLLSGDRICGLEFTQQGHVEKFTAGRVPGYSAHACFQGSDAHSVREIGIRRTYLRMDAPSLWALKQTAKDYDIRIRHSWNYTDSTYPTILGFSVNQGFFKDAPFDFHSGLNCLVGGRGTGKSTAVELLRFAFSDVSSIEDIYTESDSKVEALLGLGGRVSIRYQDSDGVVKIVERDYGDDLDKRRVHTEQGAKAEIIAAPAFFSQGELTRIAQDRTAQLDLIDRYIDTDAETNREPQIIAELRSNAMELESLQSQHDVNHQELDDREKGIKATRQKVADLQKTLADPVLKEYASWESEERYLKGAEEALNAIADEYDAAVEDIDPAAAVEDPDSDLPNHRMLGAVPRLFVQVSQKLDAAKRSVLGEVAAQKKELAKIKRGWEPLFKAKKELYDKALQKAGAADVRKADSQLRTLKKHLDELERKEKAVVAAEKKLGTLWKHRGEMLNELDEVRRKRHLKRTRKAAEWQTRFKNRITVTIAERGDRTDYAAKLRELARGAVLREPDIQAIVTNLPARELSKQLREGKADVIATKTGILKVNAQKLVEVGAGKPLHTLLELEVSALADIPDIRYEAEPGKAKTLGQLSTGQRATVIISLGLIEGNAPLVIDQPEEPLDTLAITSPVVETLREQKDKRQFILTTHNANVAVGGDAELNIVLEAGADAGRIKAAGGVDDPETNELLILHLEGGRPAIERRLGKYRPLS
jgi:predicted metal-dependent phosphoesterase TrpH/energy-coupling factor transporter ATP-binding protein EcfA2